MKTKKGKRTKAKARGRRPKAKVTEALAADFVEDADMGVDHRVVAFHQELDRLLEDAAPEPRNPSARRRAAEALSEIAARLGGQVEEPAPPSRDKRLLESAREMLTTDYYARQWGRLALVRRSEEVDDFGMDPHYAERLRVSFEFLYRRWFRVVLNGIDHVPRSGSALIVSNHSGTFPLDGLMLQMAVVLEHQTRKELRWLSEDFVFHMPFVGAFMNRIGSVRACQENAERLLDQGKLVAVFPEGIQGTSKLFEQRYRLQRFGRGGTVKLALRKRAPVIPAAIVGGEETHPLLTKTTIVGKALGLPYLPITPIFPWLGPLGLVPLPTRWSITLGEPLDWTEYGPEAADDPIVVQRLNDELRATIQTMIDRAVGERGSVFFG